MGTRIRSIVAAWESLLSARIDGRPYLWFRRLFAAKLAAFAVLTLWVSLPDPVSFVLLLLVPVSAAQAIIARSRYVPGLLGLLACEVWNIGQTFPFTLNHHFFETAVLVIMLVSSREPAEPAAEPAREPDAPASPPVVDARAVRLIQLAVISVWAYAAIQKIVHGRYWNGELMGLYGLYEDGRFAGLTARTAALISHLTGAEAAVLPLSWPASLAPQAIAAPMWLCAVLIWMGRSIILLELAIPIGLVLGPTRRLAALGLIAGQTIIALVTGEISFGLTGVLAAILFLPYRPVLYAAMALVCAAGLVITVLGVL